MTGSTDTPRLNHDAHCHVADFDDPVCAQQNCEQLGITTVCVTVSPAQFDALAALDRPASMVLAPGLHPQELPAALDQLPRLLALMDQASWVGEIGLDGVDASRETAEAQRRVLRSVLDRCVAVGRPHQRMTLHSRRTAGRLLDELDGGFPRAVLHWFSGDAAALERALAERRWFSVNPAMAGSRTGRLILRELPRDRLVYESDGPYAKHDNRPATPWDSAVVVGALARLWATSEDAVADRLNANWAALHGDAGDGG